MIRRLGVNYDKSEWHTYGIVKISICLLATAVY